ncbi:hypothetical protein, partial [Microcystis sp. M169S2]|uniref:hypothetical protein n=1 Tax=Microcystis sp. M169S2 TaxID=2771157 RepID=UPI00258B91FE
PEALETMASAGSEGIAPMGGAELAPVPVEQLASQGGAAAFTLFSPEELETIASAGSEGIAPMGGAELAPVPVEQLTSLASGEIALPPLPELPQED